jgi:hypothetical protein
MTLPRQRWRATRALSLLAAAAFLATSAPAVAQRAATGPPDWPCVQRLIPSLDWSAMWNGPSIEELERNWWDDDAVGRTVRYASTRTTPLEAALERVRRFGEEVSGDRDEKLTMLFAGLFERIGRERGQTIDAIRRYARGQVVQLEKIGKLVDQLDEARSADGADLASVQRLEQEIFWERRVFEDRQASLRALCDQPYLLEERLSRLVRAIQAEFEG